MLILISCAKLMRDKHDTTGVVESFHMDFSTPRWSENANQIAKKISQFTPADLEKRLKVNAKIAQETHENYQIFATGVGEQLPALFYYNGIVFKNIDPMSLSYDTMIYAQSHLRITSFLYGLLKPLDTIERYRLEGKFPIGIEGAKDLFSYWKPKLTRQLIEDVKKAGGTLCNLASGEMKNLFDWNQIKKEVMVITPEFLVEKQGILKNTVVYTKMARGAMTRFIIENQIKDPQDLIGFTKISDYTLLSIEEQTIQFVKKLNK